jgi:hypothetical protein
MISSDQIKTLATSEVEEETKTSQHLIGQDPLSAEQRLEQRLLLRRQWLSALEQDIRDMMDEIGDEIFGPRPPSEELPVSQSRFSGQEQPSKP